MSAGKIRWVRQRDKSSCGPIALINILKWLGVPTTYKALDFCRWVCNYSDSRYIDGGGIQVSDMEKALKYFEIKKKRKIRPKTEELNKHLDNGGIVLITYAPIEKFEEEGHFALCVGRTKKSYIMINDTINKTITLLREKTMKRMLKQKGFCNGWTWFITK